MSAPYQPLDLFFTRSGSWLSRGILWATRDDGEPKTEASHVGGIVTAGYLNRVVCVEALRRVERHRLWGKYGGSGQWMTIYRPLNIRDIDQDRIREDVEGHVGDRYGYAKIGLHLLRKLTGDPSWLRFSLLDDFPICSYLWATAFERWGYDFGIKGRRATPDDMLDYCQAHPKRWKCVRPWATL